MQPGCTNKHAHYKQDDTVWFTSLVNEHPEQWYTTVTMGFKDALAKGFDFQRDEGGEAESPGGFRGLSLQGHVRTRITAGTRGSQHRRCWETQEPQSRSCSFQRSSRNRVVCTWYPRAGYLGQRRS